MTYSDTIDSSFAISGDCMILIDKAYVKVSKAFPRIVRGWNGADYSYTKINKTLTPQQLVNVKLTDGRNIECSINTYFIIDEALTSVKLKDLLKAKKHTIYTNMQGRTEDYDYVDIHSVMPVEKQSDITYTITTVDSAHRVFINDIMIRC